LFYFQVGLLSSPQESGKGTNFETFDEAAEANDEQVRKRKKDRKTEKKNYKCSRDKDRERYSGN
jgi:hypothetical protein